MPTESTDAVKALVLGGTGFIGRRVVRELLNFGDSVVVATSGFSENPFGSSVSHRKVDRFSPEDMGRLARELPQLDVIYDLIGFGTDDVAIICEEFGEKAGHYVFVSSAGAYPEQKGNMAEEDFDPSSMNAAPGGMRELGYSGGKQNAEAYLSRNAPFTCSVPRFPVVLGHDDLAGREQFPLNRIDGRMLTHVERILRGQEIVVPPGGGRRNYAWVEDAGRFIAWLGRNRKPGAYNGASSRIMDAEEIINFIGRVLGRVPVIVPEGSDEDISSFYTQGDRWVNASKAESEGFSFSQFEKWFPVAVDNSLREVKSRNKK